MAREYEIARPSFRCCTCARELSAGEEFMARLLDFGSEFRREDLCLSCWRGGQEGAFSVWRSKVPAAQEVKKTFVDDAVLVDFFLKLSDQQEPAKVNFRFVLALMLMRKKLLIYDACAKDEQGREVWTMHLKSDAAPLAVVHPELDEPQVAEVRAQLGAILATNS
jgi:hypothetical protein